MMTKILLQKQLKTTAAMNGRRKMMMEILLSIHLVPQIMRRLSKPS
jgi:hypothetical protein